MTEGREPTLSTADLASGGERPGPEQAGAAMNVEEGETPAEPRAAGVAVAGQPAEASSAPLFAAEDAQGFRTRWDAIQTGFVDDPRQTVEQADGLVAETMKRLAQVFADERTKLEEHWSRGDNIDTESLRVALQRYRSFFDRLLSV